MLQRVIVSKESATIDIENIDEPINKVVVYKSKHGKYFNLLSRLTQREATQQIFGFIPLSHGCNVPRYTDTSIKGAMLKVINSGRELFICNNIQEYYDAIEDGRLK